MADNYLEKRMADYANGRLSRHCAPKSSGARRPFAGIPYPQHTVLIIGADTAAGADMLRAFAEAGCRVRFTASDKTAGAYLSQNAGGQFYPMNPAEAMRALCDKGERPDTVIVCDGSAPAVPQGTRLIIISESEASVPGSIIIAGSDTAQAARVALMISHPSASMPPQTIRV